MPKRNAKSDSEDGSNKKNPLKEKENSLLGNMLQHKMRGTEAVSFERSSKDLDFMMRTKTWVAAWKALEEQGFIEKCGTYYILYISCCAVSYIDTY